MMSFGLYFIWDLVGTRQRHGRDNRYEAEWERVKRVAFLGLLAYRYTKGWIG
jgi:hypothetical protein